jgi:hypothetical protein
MEKEIETLLASISNLVSDNRPWTDKRDLIMSKCSHDDEVNLNEFVSWFMDEEEEDTGV